jgi:serine/threonine-protein phosphatase PGAM5
MDAAYDRHFKPPRSGQREELLVAHANIIRYLVSRAMGDSVVKWGTYNPHAGHLTVIAVGPMPGRAMLMSFNDVGHLPRKMHTFL